MMILLSLLLATPALDYPKAMTAYERGQVPEEIYYSFNRASGAFTCARTAAQRRMKLRQAQLFDRLYGARFIALVTAVRSATGQTEKVKDFIVLSDCYTVRRPSVDKKRMEAEFGRLEAIYLR